MYFFVPFLSTSRHSEVLCIQTGICMLRTRSFSNGNLIFGKIPGEFRYFYCLFMAEENSKSTLSKYKFVHNKRAILIKDLINYLF